MPIEEQTSCETTGVIICGGGPTGAILSAMLGRMNVPNIVLEKAAEITTDPRGIALDEDGIRMIQAIGMYDRVFTRFAQCHEMLFISGSTPDLMKTPFLQMDLSRYDGTTGHVGFVFHKQPEMERAIRDAAASYECNQFRSGSTVLGIEEDQNVVEVKYADETGTEHRLRAPFLVGADGKTGYVRKQYLEPKGITLDTCEGINYSEVWVAINWHITSPTPESHPEFPLWNKGYTPEQVYDLFFPRNFRFLCNPTRPSVCGRFGLPSDRLWRFEFVVQPGEDANHMASEEQIKKIISPYIEHPGSRYGLQSSVTFPKDCITTLRSRPFSFSARSCNKWALGRVMIVGDAAHVFPPFGGQGIASGFRDANALAWRLALLHREPSTDYEKVLQAWYLERKQQFDASLAITIRNGEFVTNGNPFKAFLRDWMLWGMQLVPRWRYQIRRGERGQVIRYKYMEGLPFVPEMGGGLNLPQVFAFDFKTERVAFTDDVIFQEGKQGLFQLLLVVDKLEEAYTLLREVEGTAAGTGGKLREDEATVLVHDFEAPEPGSRVSGLTIARIASGDEFATDPELARSEPAPKGYNAFKLRQELRGSGRIVVLRPDRFVYAVCDSGLELRRCLKKFDDSLCLRPRELAGAVRSVL